MSSEPFGPIAITPREMYDALLKLTSKVDVLIAAEAQRAARDADHETRLRAIERRIWAIPAGIGATATTIVLGLAALIFRATA